MVTVDYKMIFKELIIRRNLQKLSNIIISNISSKYHSNLEISKENDGIFGRRGMRIMGKVKSGSSKAANISYLYFHPISPENNVITGIITNYNSIKSLKCYFGSCVLNWTRRF